MDNKTKWSYCVGATGRDAAYALVSMFLMLYVQYTMNLTSLQYAVISGCMILCMIWDAVNDLLMGIIIENTHFKMGKFKPWILLGSILNGAVIVCLFSIRPTGWGFVAFYVVFYLLWGMTFTMNDIAYWGVLPSLSSDAKTRDSLVTIMSVFICIGQFTVAGIVPIIVAGHAVKTYRVVALVVALAFIGFQTLTAFGITEPKRTEDKKNLGIKDMYRIFSRNDQLVCAGIASIFLNIGSNLLIIFGVNFCYIEFGYSDAGNVVTLFTVMYGLGTLISQASYASLTTRFSRMQILKVTIVFLAFGYALMLGFGYVLPKSIIVLNILGFIIFFFQGLFNLAVIVMINNTIEYDEMRFHERHDSVISAVRSFSVKLAGGVNQGLSTLVLLTSGVFLVSQKISTMEIEVDQGTKTVDQALSLANEYIAAVTPTQAFVFRVGMVGIPIIALTIAFLILQRKYRIDEAEYERIVSSKE